MGRLGGDVRESRPLLFEQEGNKWPNCRQMGDGKIEKSIVHLECISSDKDTSPLRLLILS